MMCGAPGTCGGSIRDSSSWRLHRKCREHTLAVALSGDMHEQLSAPELWSLGARFLPIQSKDRHKASCCFSRCRWEELQGWHCWGGIARHEVLDQGPSWGRCPAGPTVASAQVVPGAGGAELLEIPPKVKRWFGVLGDFVFYKKNFRSHNKSSLIAQV